MTDTQVQQPTQSEPTRTQPTQVKSWRPTRKWIAATITALAAVAVLWVQQGEFSKGVAVALIGAISQAMVTYLVPNADTPGGVPMKKVGS